MSINLLSERPISIAVARRQHIPKIDNRPISPATGYRWIKKGVLAGDGTRVRLSAVRIGRKYMTTAEAVQRFLAELTRRSSVESVGEESVAVETHAQLLANRLLPLALDGEQGQTTN